MAAGARRWDRISVRSEGIASTWVDGTGDFDGEGLIDVFCTNTTIGTIFVGIKTGTAFSFSIFATYTCDSTDERVAHACRQARAGES